MCLRCASGAARSEAPSPACTGWARLQAIETSLLLWNVLISPVLFEMNFYSADSFFIRKTIRMEYEHPILGFWIYVKSQDCLERYARRHGVIVQIGSIAKKLPIERVRVRLIGINLAIQLTLYFIIIQPQAVFPSGGSVIDEFEIDYQKLSDCFGIGSATRRRIPKFNGFCHFDCKIFTTFY